METISINYTIKRIVVPFFFEINVVPFLEQKKHVIIPVEQKSVHALLCFRYSTVSMYVFSNVVGRQLNKMTPE
jgi:bisphosphoglycerate-dependent phosphoglycerate mutase